MFRIYPMVISHSHGIDGPFIDVKHDDIPFTKWWFSSSATLNNQRVTLSKCRLVYFSTSLLHKTPIIILSYFIYLDSPNTCAKKRELDSGQRIVALILDSIPSHTISEWTPSICLSLLLLHSIMFDSNKSVFFLARKRWKSIILLLHFSCLMPTNLSS